ncbi:PREDICTED: protein EMSY-LIKE 1-like [Camelina sativa]|uniref:Protein EMSY-LIKE 1-like n=1 Tax=Camelina sativa TaxID=90675 RepID=A0ABM1RL45_CAMSA|nr:PREDICTED: protein EMSY-LIKE 1-like [Camelina sativa]
MAEKSLRAPESKSESDSGDGDVTCLSAEDVTKETLTVQEYQMKAFYHLLQVFALETSTMSNKRTEIIEKLMNEWGISDETCNAFADKIQKNLLKLEKRYVYISSYQSFNYILPREDASVSDEKETQIVPETPLAKPVTASRSSTYVPKSGKIWGSVNPESLIGKCVHMRLPEEADFNEYIIKAYDAEQEMHRVMAADSNAMEVDDSYSMIDLREVSPEDILWEGEIPNFDAPKQSTTRRSLF